MASKTAAGLERRARGDDAREQRLERRREKRKRGDKDVSRLVALDIDACQLGARR